MLVELCRTCSMIGKVNSRVCMQLKNLIFRVCWSQWRVMTHTLSNLNILFMLVAECHFSPQQTLLASFNQHAYACLRVLSGFKKTWSSDHHHHCYRFVWVLTTCTVTVTAHLEEIERNGCTNKSNIRINISNNCNNLHMQSAMSCINRIHLSNKTINYQSSNSIIISINKFLSWHWCKDAVWLLQATKICQKQTEIDN